MKETQCRTRGTATPSALATASTYFSRRPTDDGAGGSVRELTASDLFAQHGGDHRCETT